jgi:hypothetical protein
VLWIVDDPDPLSDGVTHSPVSRTIHPPPWPWTIPSSTPTVTSTEGSVPSSITWKSSSPGPTCTSTSCGHRCTGLFCHLPCVGLGCLNLDPDFIDFDDPKNPYGSKNPYTAEPEECTTTTASDCATSCVADTSTVSCDTSCSTIFACEATDTSVIGTQTLAPVASMYYEFWTSDAGDAFTSSVYAAVQSELDADFPTTTTTTTTSSSTAPAATVAYDIYEWICDELETVTTYNVGLASGTYCSARDNIISGNLVAVGNTFSICGSTKTITSYDSKAGSYAIGTTGLCSIYSDGDPGGCTSDDGASCLIYKRYTCTDSAC